MKSAPMDVVVVLYRAYAFPVVEGQSIADEGKMSIDFLNWVIKGKCDGGHG